MTAARAPGHLRRSGLPSDSVELARFLIGKLLVHDAPEGRASGRIVETEAYLPHDPASHSFRGMTPRNASMFLERGFAYVYRIYGAALCVNVSSEGRGIGAAVLLRALEPTEGVALMHVRRGNVPVRDLARGPGRLTVALGITTACDGVDLCGRGPLWLGSQRSSGGTIGESVRIGLTRAADEVLRFYERGSPFVSGTRRLSP